MRFKLAVAISVAALAGGGGGALYALAEGPGPALSLVNSDGHVRGCAPDKHAGDVASGHQRKCRKSVTPAPSAVSGAPSSSPSKASPSRSRRPPSSSPSSSSAPPPVAGGNYDCQYRTDTWSADASSVGYSVQKISASDGKKASYSVRLNADRGTTEVVGYPSDQCLIYTALPRSLTSRYEVTPPASSSGLDYEFAYDIWLTTASAARSYNWDNDLELMIWTYVRGQRPAGSKVATLGDGSAVWFDGTKGSNNSTVSVVLPSNKTSGTVDIAGIVGQLKARGYVPSSDDGILDVEYGIEAPYGGGNRFDVSALTVTG